MSGGTLSANYEYLGNAGSGVFTQTGGTNNVVQTGYLYTGGYLYLGYIPPTTAPTTSAATAP